jgi:hypothetical protein
MQGRRIDWRPGFPGDWAQPGDYMPVPEGVHPEYGEAEYGGGVWYVMAPDGGVGALVPWKHTMTEVDGILTVEPSIVMPNGWHGWLNAGVWNGA